MSGALTHQGNLSDLIGLIYDAATADSEEAYHLFLREFAIAICGTSNRFLLSNSVYSDTGFLVCSGCKPPARKCLISGQREGTSLPHLIGGLSYKTSSGMIFCVQPNGRPPFQEKQLVVLEQLIPHLARSTRIRKSLQQLNSKRYLTKEVLNRIGVGIFVLNKCGIVTFTNEAGRAILDCNDGLHLRNNSLETDDSNETSILRNLIQRALDFSSNTDEGEYQGDLLITRPSSRRPLIGLMYLLSPNDGQDSAAMLFVIDPERKPVLSGDTLKTLYHFTDAEMRLALSLANGMTLEQACLSQSIRISTGRSYLKQIFLKTDTNRQAELVRIFYATALI